MSSLISIGRPQLQHLKRPGRCPIACHKHAVNHVRASRRDAGLCRATVPSADIWLWSASKWTFPTYLQVADDHDAAHSAHTRAAAMQVPMAAEVDLATALGWDVWDVIRRQAEQEASKEPLLSSFLNASVLEHDCFQHSLAFVLANRLATSTLLSAQLYDIFCSVMADNPEVPQSAMADIEAFHTRDPACTSHIMALLYYKGYHSLQTHRMAHALWRAGKRLLALTLQSRLSEVFAVDIHPGAQIGSGVFVDHACGVVIGETAVIGNNVTIMQDVTLGGTGKETGDRHPKIDDNVLIGASAKVLGNITIGKGALIAPGSLVLKPVEPNTMVAGAPAQFVGCRKALNAQQQQLQQLEQEVLPAVVLPAAAAAPATAEHSQQQQQQHLEQQEEQQPTYSKMQTWAASTTQPPTTPNTPLSSQHNNDTNQQQQQPPPEACFAI